MQLVSVSDPASVKDLRLGFRGISKRQSLLRLQAKHASRTTAFILEYPASKSFLAIDQIQPGSHKE